MFIVFGFSSYRGQSCFGLKKKQKCTIKLCDYSICAQVWRQGMCSIISMELQEIVTFLYWLKWQPTTEWNIMLSCHICMQRVCAELIRRLIIYDWKLVLITQPCERLTLGHYMSQNSIEYLCTLRQFFLMSSKWSSSNDLPKVSLENFSSSAAHTPLLRTRSNSWCLSNYCYFQHLAHSTFVSCMGIRRIKQILWSSSTYCLPNVIKFLS